MDLRDSPEDEAFRKEVRAWLADHLVGEFAALGGRGGSGDETYGFEVRLAWEQRAGRGRLDLPRAGRSSTAAAGRRIAQQVIFNEEYVRAGAPGRVGIIGEGLLGPTLIHYGTEAQKARFLPPILAGTELWCQGYSEPDAGSDLANVPTRAVLDGDEWVVTGQKVWTSLAHQADWCFVRLPHRARTPTRHQGLSYLLVPMDQPGIEIRPIRQLTGTSEFNEVFFDGARTAADHVVGEVGDGWRVALATLAFERGVALLGHQLAFRARARPDLRRGPGERASAATRWCASAWPRAYAELRDHALQHPAQPVGRRRPGGPARGLDRQALLGQLAPAPGRAGHGRARARRPPCSRAAPTSSTTSSAPSCSAAAETIYGGSNEIQRNIIGERVLGLPPEPKGAP